MANALGYIVSAAQIVAGAILTAIPGTQAIGVPLLISGFANAALTALAPRPLGGDGGWSSSPTYGWDQLQNAAFEGMPEIIVYGEHRIAPSIISAITEQSGKKQTLKILCHCGHGGEKGYESITGIELNDEPITNYQKVETTTRLGTATQTKIQGFEKVGVPYPVDFRLEKGDWITYTTKGRVDEVALVLSWRGGLYHIDGTGKDAGKIESTEWRARIQYRTAGSSDDWTEVKGPKNIKDDGWYRLSDGGWGTKQKKTTEFKLIARFTIPTRERIEIQIKGREEDKDRYKRIPNLIRIEEIEHDARAYARSALLAIEAVADSQLSGGLPRITCLVRGRKVYNPATSTWAWSRNNALIIRDFLLDSRNACGNWISSADIDDGAGGSWRTVAATCDENAASSGVHAEARHQLDIVVDSFQPASDWLSQMLMACRSQIIESTDPTTLATSLKLVRDQATASTRTFDARQSRDASATRPVLSAGDRRADIAVRETPSSSRPNIVRALYYDRDDKNRRRWTDEITVAGTDPEVRQELHLAGVTRETEAIRQSRWILNKSRLTPWAAEIGVTFGDLDLLPGDVITVSADSPPWSSQLLMVEATQYAPLDLEGRGTGKLLCRKYDANVYADTVDPKQIKVQSFSRADALKLMRSIPRGATNVKLEEIPGSTHLRVTWSADPDLARRIWRVYHGSTVAEKGELQAEIDPLGTSYIVRNVDEGLSVVRVLAVSMGGTEEDWGLSGGVATRTVNRRAVSPATVQQAYVTPVDPKPQIQVGGKPPAPDDPPQKVEAVRVPTSVNADWGQLVATRKIVRDDVTEDAGVSQTWPTVTMTPGRTTGNEAIVVRGVTEGGQASGPGSEILVPTIAPFNRTPTVIASVVTSALTNINAPDSTMAWEVGANGITMRAITPSSAMNGGWGTVSSAGLYNAQPSGARYCTAATITIATYDLGSSKEFMLECFDEAQRNSAVNPMTTIESRFLTALPSNPGDSNDGTGYDLDGTDVNPMWAMNRIRSDGRPFRPLPPTRWQVAVSESATPSTYREYVPGMLCRGRYVIARALLKDPIGWHQLVSPYVYVRVWTAHAAEDHPQVFTGSTVTTGDIVDIETAVTGEIVGIVNNAGTVRLVLNVGGTLFHVNLSA